VVVAALPRLAAEGHPQVLRTRHQVVRGHRGRLRRHAGARAAGMLHDEVQQEVAAADSRSADPFRLDLRLIR